MVTQACMLHFLLGFYALVTDSKKKLLNTKKKLGGWDKL